MSEEKKKPFNPSFGDGYSNDSFGEGSILIKLSPENLDSLMKNTQAGSSLLVRFNKETKYGNKHYFCDILPPLDKKNYKPKAKTAGSDLD